TVWMSATLRREWLGSVDFRERAGALSLFSLDKPDFEFVGLKERYYARKMLAMAEADATAPASLAKLIKDQHRDGTLTLVVVNTVERSRILFDALRTLYVPKSSRGGKKPQVTSNTTDSGKEIDRILI